MRTSDVASLLLQTIPAKLPVCLVGPPGIGKTDLVVQACEALGVELMLSHPVVDEPIDYKGLPMVVDGKAMFGPYGGLNRAINATSPLVWFMDDLGPASTAVQAACTQILHARRIGDHAVSEHVTIMAATNGVTHRSGVRSLLETVKSRFAAMIEVEANAVDWCVWALRRQVRPEVVSFIRAHPQRLVDDKLPANPMANTYNPRTILNACRLLDAGVPAALEFETISGATGEGWATEFMAHLTMYRNLINLERILAMPGRATVPRDTSVLYAVATGLARLASPETAAAIVQYAERLPGDFNCLLINDCTEVSKLFQLTPAFGQPPGAPIGCIGLNLNHGGEAAFHCFK